MADEFSVIDRYFNWPHAAQSVIKAVGDDAAILKPPAGQVMLVSSDTFIEDVHFPKQTCADAIGYKALAVNLSDLAAMGAEPAWFTLALTLPDSDSHWLEAFSQGMRRLADQAGVALVGGDTTRGDLSITITIMGLAAAEQVMRRDTAQPGDDIYISGHTGLAAAGLAHIQNRITLKQADRDACLTALNYPQPRNSEARLIRRFASSCIDISDGLLADLGHILAASGCGATLDEARLPLAKGLASLPQEQALGYVLQGGDDYELLFSIPRCKREAFEQACQQHQMMCHRIGRIDADVQGIVTAKGLSLDTDGFKHFR